MNVTVFGLGYVGCVTAACLAEAGHRVTGVDVNPEKVRAVQEGRSPIIEPGLEASIAANRGAGRLVATTSAEEGLAAAELAVVCVGTPSRPNGSLELRYLERVAEQIGHSLARRTAGLVVVLRSTMLPGTHSHVLSLLEASSGRKAGVDFGLCVNPEFLREGSAISDFGNPPFTLIGELDPASGDTAAALYAHLDAPLHRVSLGVAELVKYASNAFHGLKVTFANEIGAVSQAYGVDGTQVMALFTQDMRLNLSPYYLKPGFAYGGSCLGKDLRALNFAARQKDLHLPVLESVAQSNQLHIRRAVDMVLREGRRRVGVLGLSFKSATDDLRESPAVELVEQLLGKGLDVHIYDHEVSLSRVHGANREYIEQVLPHIASLLRVDLGQVVAEAEVLVVTKRPPAGQVVELLRAIRPDQVLIDLVNLRDAMPAEFSGNYRGIAW
jgi:GDP-mannose 6-dehydrogenase